MAAFRWRNSSSSAVSVARLRNRWKRSSSDGGMRKTRSAPGTFSLTTWAPWTSILRMTSRPAARPVPVAMDLVGLEELPSRPLRGEGLRVEEEVVDAVDLAGPHRPSRAGDDVVVVRIMVPQLERVDDGVLADPARPRDDHQ